MKKGISLFLIIAMMFSFAACHTSNTNTPSNSATPIIKDPQQEASMSYKELNDIVQKTGKLTNYKIAYTYSSDVDNVVTILMHDGVNVQSQNVIKNNIASDGSLSLESSSEYKYVFSQNKKYSKTDDKWIAENYTFKVSAPNATYAYTINQLTCEGFFETIKESLNVAKYDIIHDYYSMPDINLTHNNEAFVFEDVFLTFKGGYLFSIVCSNRTQTILIELTGINNVEEQDIPNVQYEALTPDADIFFKENTTIISTTPVDTSNNVRTEAAVFEDFKERGFVTHSITTEYKMDGIYYKEVPISSESTDKHPIYKTYYESNNNVVWIIFEINGEIFANPFSYNLESEKGIPHMLTEKDTITSYDSTTNQFYVNIPNSNVMTLEKVDVINIETLNNWQPK